MTVHRLPVDAVILDAAGVRLVLAAVHHAQRARVHLDALPRSSALDALAASLSPWPHADTPEEGPGHADSMTTTQAADLLGVSPRTARRRAPQLGGRLVAGTWLLDAAAVDEHARGANL